MEKERFLDANTRGNLADNDASSVRFFAIDTDYNALKNLETEFVTFFNFLGDLNGVTRTDVNNSFLLLGVTNLL